MTFNDPQPIAIPPGAGKVLPFLSVQHKLTSQQTGGGYYLFESDFGPGDGNKLHVHSYDDEVAYVLEGSLAVRLGDQDLEVGAGGVAFLPKNIPHALRNPLGTTSRYLFAAIPGESLQLWFEAVQAAADTGTLDDANYRALSLQYGLEWLE